MLRLHRIPKSFDATWCYLCYSPFHRSTSSFQYFVNIIALFNMCCDMVLVMLLPVLLINLTFSIFCKYESSFQIYICCDIVLVMLLLVLLINLTLSRFCQYESSFQIYICCDIVLVMLLPLSHN